MASMNLMQLGDPATLTTQPSSYMGKPIKCFLCDWNFCAGEEPWLLFEKRFSEDGLAENSLAAILSSALSVELHESTSHSALVCESCKTIILEYESQEQRFCEMRYRILSSYNSTAKKNHLQPIAVEVNGVLQDIYQTTIKEEQDGPNATGYFGVLPKHEQLGSMQDGDDEQQQPQQQQQSEQPEEQQEQIQYVPLGNEPPTASNIQISDFIVYEDIIEEEEEFIRDDQQQDMLEEEQDESSPEDQNGNTFLDPPSALLFNINNESEDSDANSLLSTLPGLPLTIDEHSLSGDPDNEPDSFFVRDGDNFLCQLCPDVEAMGQDEFMQHLSDSHRETLCACVECGNCYLSAKELSEHVREDHMNATQRYECKPCALDFADPLEFRHHRRQHNASGRQHQCSVCAKRYASKNQLDEHMNTHTGERPFKCPQCPKDFHSKYSLQTHLKIHTERPREFACDECDKTFLKQQTLAQHKKLHASDKPFLCEICSKAFITAHNLAVHRIVHTGQKPFFCRICNKAFARRAEIRDHERTHTGERPFQCDLCPAAFAQRSNLMSHKKTTHLNQKLHHCQQCNRSFKRRRLLDYHIKSVHTGERPHKCEICKAAFVYPEHYKKHMIIHSDQKPYACEVCGKQFSSRDNRNAHRFVHSAKKPYECVQCGAGFMRKPLLLAHMKQTKHLMGTIIVNQPVIKGFEFAVARGPNCEELEGSLVDSDVAHSQSEEHQDLEVTDDLLGNHVQSNAENTLAKLTDQLLADDDVDIENIDIDTIVHGNPVLMKPEIGNVKYLQFDELDGDGQESLTWVDIDGEKN